MWECASAVSIGTAHIERDGVCQDRCSARVFDQPGKQWVAVFVSDGAGSAQHGELGAEMAITTANETVSQLIQLPDVALDETLATQILSDVRQSIALTAEEEQRPMRAYACTFLGAIASPSGTIVFQIGDGGIVIDAGEGLELALEPMQGEYANMTYFVSDHDSIQRMAVKRYPAGVKSMVLFSDGLQRLALDMVNGVPHAPFFEPILRKVAALNDTTRPQICGALESFLGSPRINERTDDDKSLAIAVLRA